MISKKIYLIIYKEHNSIEGYVNKPEDFIKWLWKHNKKRNSDKEIIEREHEFEVKEVLKLI